MFKGLLEKIYFRAGTLKLIICGELSFLVLVTGQGCSLKCRHCGNFSPYLSALPPPPPPPYQNTCNSSFRKKPFLFYPYEDICSDLEAITKTVKNIRLIQIQGGEFFLHPDAVKILRYIKSNTAILNVCIATNGTIVPSDEILLEIKNSKISYIRISNYTNCSENASKLKQKLDEFNIKNGLFNFAGDKTEWIDLGGIDMQRIDDRIVKKTFKKCPFRGCLTLENGFIGRCSRSVVAHFVQNFNLAESDGINVRKPFTRQDLLNFAYGSFDLLKFTYSNHPVTGCYYCYGSGGKSILPAEQMTTAELSLHGSN